MIGASFADKLRAVVYRDLLTAVRYRSGFLIKAGGTVAELAAFYYLAHAIGPGFRPNGFDYFSFLLVGTGFYTFLVTGVHSFLQIVQEAQSTGTLEVLLATSTPAPTLIVLSAISAFSASAVQFVFYIGAGMVMSRATFAAANLAGCLVVFLLSLAIGVAIGIFAAALQLSTHKGSAVLWLLGSGTWFMTGTLFPVSTLPAPLRFISTLIPITHSLDAMRLALLEGLPVAALSHEIAILMLFACALLPTSLVVLAHSVTGARRQGTLSSY